MIAPVGHFNWDYLSRNQPILSSHISQEGTPLIHYGVFTCCAWSQAAVHYCIQKSLRQAGKCLSRSHFQWNAMALYPTSDSANLCQCRYCRQCRHFENFLPIILWRLFRLGYISYIILFFTMKRIFRIYYNSSSNPSVSSD